MGRMNEYPRVRNGWVIPVLAMLAACGGDDPVDPGPPADPVADVAATATGPASVPVGADATFEATATNGGPDAAAGVVLTATLPDGATATAISGGGSQSGSMVSWSIGSLADGASATRTLTIAPDEAGTISVVATASADTDDPDASNNDGSSTSAVAETMAIVSADVVATISQPDPALPGDEVTWTLTIRNDGPSDAEDIVAQLEVEGVTSALTASDGGTVDAGVVTWPAIATLADGASMEFTVTATTPLVSPMSATVSASAASNDASPGNNDGSSGDATSLVVVTFDAVRTLNGEAGGDQFGWLMDVVGDVDGDGIDDVIIGAPGNDAGGTDAGRAYIYSAATGTLIHTFTGSAGERMGTGVDGAGDVNDDGVPDAIIGGPAPAGGTGRMVVISGADGSVLLDIAGEADGDGFGRSVSRLGDVNGDGHDDVVVGATFRGRVYVIDGDTGATLATRDGPAFYGAAVGEIGDLNADGIPDFAVGSSQAAGGGRVHALSGVDASELFSVGPSTGGASLGDFWVNTPGDLNGDGLNDIFASDIIHGGQAGRAYVFSGADGSLLVEATGEAGGDQFGIGRGIPDVNGDGVGDLFVAGWQNDEGAGGAGKAYVVSGADGATLRSFASTTAGENLGFDAIGIEDVTGDGIPDYLVSGGISPSTPGRVYVIAGVALD